MPDEGTWSTVWDPTGTWRRHPVRTRWLQPGDDLVAVLDACTAELRRGTDTVAVSEKVAVLLTHRAVPRSTVAAGRLARFLARHVQPVGDSRGLSIPEKMQLVVERQGRVRVLAAALSAGLLRPLGHRGAFYRLAGTFARDLDGLRPPYLDLLLPPLEPRVARRLAQAWQERLGCGVAIVDVNDRGGSVRAVSSAALPAGELLTALGDNPMGQGTSGTPIVLVRRSPSGQQPA